MPSGLGPTATSVGFLVRVATSIVETVLSLALVTKAGVPFGVIATSLGDPPTGMLDGFRVLVATSMVATALRPVSTTNAVLPSGEIATALAKLPVPENRMSFGSLVRVGASIVDTRSSPPAG